MFEVRCLPCMCIVCVCARRTYAYLTDDATVFICADGLLNLKPSPSPSHTTNGNGSFIFAHRHVWHHWLCGLSIRTIRLCVRSSAMQVK